MRFGYFNIGFDSDSKIQTSAIAKTKARTYKF